MLSRLINPSQLHSFFLFGARGTGKTSLVRERFLNPSTLYIDLLLDSEFESLNLKPDSLLERLAGLPSIDRVVIDEVQKIPAILDLVHRILEQDRKHQFILTGSSARKLKRGGGNLLAGRAWVYHLFPMTSTELGDLFNLHQTLAWGSLPRLLELSDDGDKLEFFRAYTSTYLKEEILQEQLIRELRPFQRFLPIAAQTSGEIVNYSKIARDIGVAPPTVESYFQILEDTMLGFRLPSYHPLLRKQERLSPKFYLFDIGVTRSLMRQLQAPPQQGTYAFGKLFEQFIILEIIRLSSYQRRDDAFFYYQTYGDLEVDLVIDRPGEQPIFIEIKSAEQVQDSHVAHLAAIAADLPAASYYCFSLDKHPARKGAIYCLHWTDGLRELGLV